MASEGFARLELTAEKVHVARHDPLTDLPNRGILLDRLTQALVSRPAAGEPAWPCMFLDLDGFKPVNDRFGHAAGDAVLIELARRLRECVRESDTSARLGGDEFAILSRMRTTSRSSSLCARLMAAVGAAYRGRSAGAAGGQRRRRIRRAGAPARRTLLRRGRSRDVRGEGAWQGSLSSATSPP